MTIVLLLVTKESNLENHQLRENQIVATFLLTQTVPPAKHETTKSLNTKKTLTPLAYTVPPAIDS